MFGISLSLIRAGVPNSPSSDLPNEPLPSLMSRDVYYHAKSATASLVRFVIIAFGARSNFVHRGRGPVSCFDYFPEHLRFGHSSSGSARNALSILPLNS
jgi:hypothetical protein